MLTKCEGVFVPRAIAVRRRKEVYTNKMCDINARRVRDAILEGKYKYPPSKTRSIFFSQGNTLR